MSYLLDTCILSELAKKKPCKRVLEWLEQRDEETLFLSVLTFGEIQKGISKCTDGVKKSRLQQWLDDDLRQRFSGRVLPISTEICLTWGMVLGKAEAAGKPIPVIDGLLGATAVVHRLTVVTRNEGDIAAAGVSVFNPWSW